MCRLYEIDTNARLNCMDWVSGIHPEDRDRTVKAFESSLLGGNRFNNQYRVVGKQTFEIKHLDVFGQHFKNRLGITTRTIGVTINVSEHKLKQESELVEKALDMQRSKTLALGELAAGIGHEINNPLSILTGNLDLLKSH